MRARRVGFAAPPFSALSYPSIGLSLLKAALHRRGIASDIHYLYLRFADRIGAVAHDLIVSSETYHALVGEWIFAPFIDETPRPGWDTDLSYFTDVFAAEYPDHFTHQRVHAFMLARTHAEAFLEACMTEVDWSAYGIIGFTTSFQQNTAALALARRIKRRHPETLIVFGGANCRGEMGVELLRQFEFIDVVCTDESDITFPAFAEEWLDGAEPPYLPGLLRRGSPHAETLAPSLVRDMDALPYPDFSDFFTQHAVSDVARRYYPPVALFETSRGCWWGEKHHCTFCGINGLSMAFRSKSPERAFAEIATLARDHGTDLVNVDAILDHRYFTTLLPMLAELPEALTVYYELKSNLRPEHFPLLAAAGITKIQPGIESLDSGILAMMNKGVTRLQNAQTLKLAAEYGLYVEWNLLRGFPGETTAQYRDMLSAMRQLIHLQAPSAFWPVRADRFSPYFNNPAAYGIRVEPNAAYSHIYKFSPGATRALAYHFQIVSDAPGPSGTVLSEVAAACAAWSERPVDAGLTMADDGETIEISDRRPGWPAATHGIGGIEAKILRDCWRIVSVRALSAAYGLEVVQAAVTRLEPLGLLMVEAGNVLCLALRNTRGTAPDWQAIRDRTITAPVWPDPPAVAPAPKPAFATASPPSSGHALPGSHPPPAPPHRERAVSLPAEG